VAIQGFGNVGSAAAEFFVQHGAKVVAVQDAGGTVLDERGLDVAALSAAVRTGPGVTACKGVDRIANEDFWAVKSDFLIPAAMEGQLTAERARTVATRMVVEGANGPTSPAADDILRDRGIAVIPDVIANAGGVTVSYFEWVQDFSSFFWDEDEINRQLERILVGAFRRIHDLADSRRISLRTATYAIACERILMAREIRGLYP
jgi:glutamate dehydrogenase (NAD(P)+)